MKQKTPLLEAIEKIKLMNLASKNPYETFAYATAVGILTELLPKEKEVITDTYDDGYVNGMQDRKPSSLDYFNKTFTQK